jgi:hypothetical protein
MTDPWNGGVAQLGERLLCKQEVIGSIPFTSTMGTSTMGISTMGLLIEEEGGTELGMKKRSSRALWSGRAVVD